MFFCIFVRVGFIVFVVRAEPLRPEALLFRLFLRFFVRLGFFNRFRLDVFQYLRASNRRGKQLRIVCYRFRHFPMHGGFRIDMYRLFLLRFRRLRFIGRCFVRFRLRYRRIVKQTRHQIRLLLRFFQHFRARVNKFCLCMSFRFGKYHIDRILFNLSELVKQPGKNILLFLQRVRLFRFTLRIGCKLILLVNDILCLLRRTKQGRKVFCFRQLRHLILYNRGSMSGCFCLYWGSGLRFIHTNAKALHQLFQ